MPCVSIVTPCHNSAKTIKKTLYSVQGQTFSDYEHIVVDDDSSDNSVEIVESFASTDPRVKLIRNHENAGAAVARNMAIDASEGRYITFLDSDDTWLPSKLEDQLEFIKLRNADLVFSAYRKIDELGNDLGVVGVPEKVTYQQLLKSCVIGCLTAMYDTHHLGKVYMPLIRKRQDLGLWLKILKMAGGAYGQNEVLAEYTVRRSSISSNKKSAARFQWKLYREVEELSLLRSGYYFSHYAIRGVLRSKFSRIAKIIGVLD